MKLLITGIVISIIIIFSLIILNRNIYFSEDFSNARSYDQDTIEDLIDIAYIPENPYEKEEISEYDVIDIYKKILDRSPTANEIRYSILVSKNKLIEDLYNSFEYDKSLKLQNNNANVGIEGALAKRNLINKLNEIYKRKYKKEIPDKMVMPLRDCYIHLRSNYYLFVVMVENANYPKFENEVLTSITLSKKLLLQLFRKHFNLLELKLLAQNKIKVDKVSGDTSFNKIKEDLDKLRSTIPNNSNTDTSNNVALSELNAYLNPSSSPNKPLSLKEGYVNNDDKELEELKKLIKTREPERLKDDVIKNLPKGSEVYVRVYDPINYKQTYRGTPTSSKDMYRPPICTSLGQPQLTSPIFTESKLLFQGTDIDKAFDETQVGSIMPKFTYREYQDVRIQ